MSEYNPTRDVYVGACEEVLFRGLEHGGIRKAVQLAEHIRKFPAPPEHVPVATIERIRAFISETIDDEQVKQNAYFATAVQTLYFMLDDAVREAKS